MQLKTEQAPQKTKKQNYLIRWIKNFLFIILGMFGFLSVTMIAVGIYIAYNPVNITPFVKYCLPFPIIKGIDKHHPAGTFKFDKLVLTWSVRQQGFSAPLKIELHKGEILDNKGKIQGSIEYAELKLAIFPLFYRNIEPVSLHISGTDLRLKRTENQKIELDVVDQKETASKLEWYFNLKHLNQVTIQNSHLKLTDEVDKRVIQLKQIDMNILPFYIHDTLGVVGHVVAQLDIDGRFMNISAQSGADGNVKIARQMLDNTGLLKWHVQINQFNPADFSGLSPSLKSLKQIDIPVSLMVDISLKAGKEQATIEPYDTQLTLKMGAGRIGFKGQDLYPSSANAQIHANFTTDLKKPIHVSIDEMVLQLRSPKTLDQDQSGPLFQFTGSLFLSSLIDTKNIKVNFAANSPALDFSTVKNYWPSSVAKGAHAWVTENITSGQVKDFKIEAGLVSNNGWKNLKLSHLGGGIKDANQMEVHWLRPVPPLKEMKATMQFVDPNRIHIQFQGGYQMVYPHNKQTEQYHKLFVPQGDMWITGLSNDQETGIITAKIQGHLQDTLALLYEPRLRLLSRHPLPFKNVSGEIITTLKVELPLKKKVTMDQISIQGHNDISKAYFDNVALEKPLKNASLIIDVDTHHLELSGKGIFSVFPVVLKYTQNFTHKNSKTIMETAEAKLDITPENLKQMMVDTSGDFLGKISLLVNYQKIYNGQAVVKLKFDLLKAAIYLPIWRKIIGQPAQITGEIGLNQSKLVAIKNVSAQGKDLSINANIDVANYIPKQLNITSFRIGRSVGQASLNFPMTQEAIDNPQKGDIRVSVAAKTLDAVPFVSKYIGKDTKANNKQKTSDKYQLPIAATGSYSGPRGRKWIVNLQAQKIYYKQDQFFSSVTAYMEYNGVRLMRLSYGMRKPFLVTASLFPKGKHRYFHLEAQNFGHILETFGVLTQLKGGDVIFKGQFDDTLPAAPFYGHIDIKNIALQDAPVAMRQLSNASIYGLFKHRQNKEIILDKLKGDLFYNEGALKIINGMVYNAELGATLQGVVNLDQSLFNLNGTIVPVYAVNKLFGYLPWVGRLLSPEKGGGVVAIPFDIKGNFNKPQFNIYPSRILTPGALRELF